jgi:uncharacterized protein (TIGR02677 family)
MDAQIPRGAQGRAGPRPFAHLDAPLHELYRAIMTVFRDGKQRFVVHLRPEDVAADLRRAAGPAAGQEQVDDALVKLEEWGNLRANPDTSRVTTVEDFYRTRYLYQLSREGEAAERALEVYDREMTRRAELQAVALEDIRLRLRALRELPAEPDPAVVHSLLLELSGRLDSLAANATAFMGSLQRTIELQDVDEETFLAYKDRLISYLERFVSELVVKSHDIAATLRGIDASRAGHLLRIAARREAADVAPGAEPPEGEATGNAGPWTGASSSPSTAPAADPVAADDPVAEKLRDWKNRWSGLWSWFVDDGPHQSQATMLRKRARKAIPDLLGTISVLQERRAGRSDRSADFRALARWFAEAPDAADAHRLWRVAFGLSPSRHLTGEAETGADAVTAGTSWLAAPPVVIAPRLRATGQYQRRGGPVRIRDRSAEREHLARQVRAEREQTEAARSALATGAPTRLSELGVLGDGEFRLFLRLLGEALSAGPPGPDGTIRTRTSDGTMEIVLRPLDSGPAAEISTDDGVLRGPDHEIVITDLTEPMEPRPADPGPARPDLVRPGPDELESAEFQPIALGAGQ